MLRTVTRVAASQHRLHFGTKNHISPFEGPRVDKTSRRCFARLSSIITSNLCPSSLKQTECCSFSPTLQHWHSAQLPAKPALFRAYTLQPPQRARNHILSVRWRFLFSSPETPDPWTHTHTQTQTRLKTAIRASPVYSRRRSRIQEPESRSLYVQGVFLQIAVNKPLFPSGSDAKTSHFNAPQNVNSSNTYTPGSANRGIRIQLPLPLP
ncbi:hypothetical protein QBC44DRAFT_67728 [Cladorrhinum sp. PSN332]|nr:hypothetical protein QBC44DRAFT_67728 [Cladorrhinum sp. PSN332]